VRTIRLLPVLALLWTVPGIAASKVMVVLSKFEAPYEQLVQAIRASATASRADVEIGVHSMSGFDAALAGNRQPALIVSVGVEAARHIAQTNPSMPILHTLLPRAAAQELLQPGRKARDSAIYLDQPVGRQLDLLRAALPRHKRVTVILGPTANAQTQELRSAARERGLKLDIVTIAKRDQMLPALEKALDDSDVLVSIPDPLVYHSETIHHLLLTTYRHRIPAVGLSKSSVEAGALLAVYSTPEHIGRQVGEVLAALAAKGESRLPPAQHPRYFTLSVNRRVAASLDLVLDNENTLLRKLEALQRQ
jgi:putative tryptophan/tyrosine transport system substrate-binding protein